MAENDISRNSTVVCTHCGAVIAEASPVCPYCGAQPQSSKKAAGVQLASQDDCLFPDLETPVIVDIDHPGDKTRKFLNKLFSRLTGDS